MKNSKVTWVLILLLFLKRSVSTSVFYCKEEQETGTLVASLEGGAYTIGAQTLYQDGKKVSGASDDPVFYIDEENKLRTSVVIDRDTWDGDSYELLLLPTNGEGDLKLLTINLVDVNDNVPTFDQNDVTVEISEDARDGATKLLPKVVDADEDYGLSTSSFELVGW